VHAVQLSTQGRHGLQQKTPNSNTVWEGCRSAEGDAGGVAVSELCMGAGCCANNAEYSEVH
jgi:hypothetical protein